MATFLDSIVDISPGVRDSWQNVDLSAYCPAGTTGIVFKVVNATATAEAIGWRKNGSTDNRVTDMDDANHFWAGCGVDGNRVLQLYAGANISIWLIGYFGAEAVFFTNAIDKSFATTGSWEDVDISANINVGDTAQLAFLEVRGLSLHDFGLRANGSANDVHSQSTGTRGGCVKVDGTGLFECFIGNAADDIYLTGYLRAGAVIATDFTDVTPGSGGSYVDLPALPAGAVAGIYQSRTSAATYKNALHCNGAAEDHYSTLNRHVWAIVKCDAGRVVEAKVSFPSMCKIYELGYLTDLPTPAITNLSSASGYVGDSVIITGTGFNATQGVGSVTFNGVAATITSWADTSIVCTVPVGVTTGNIVVTNLWGNASTGTAYTVKSLPTATAIGSGCPGDDVTIDGSDFGAVQGTVAFDVTAASVVSWADAQIVITVPVGAINCTVTITNGDGKTCTIGFALGDCGGASSTPETPIHTGNPIGAGPNVGLSPVR